MDPRWQHPFTCIVAGPTGCGKTTFVARLLRNASAMIDPPPERVTWYYGEWQKAYENLDIPNVRLEEGLPTSFDNGKRGLVVLDDLMAETDSRVTPYGYLLIDLKQNTPDDMRLRTSVLPDDAHQWVYVPK